MSTFYPTDFTPEVLADVAEERVRQHEKWGPQHHPDGTAFNKGSHGMGGGYGFLRDHFTLINDELPAGAHNWDTILLEELFEALAESDLQKLRTELIQVAAVAVAWVEDIDSRGGV